MTAQLDDGGAGKRTLSIDFDGVTHAYRKGWHDGTIYDGPVDEAREAFELLAQHFKLVISTCREDIPAIKAWIAEHIGMDLEVTNLKPIASAYIDDRALRFESWAQTLSDLKALFPVLAAGDPQSVKLEIHWDSDSEWSWITPNPLDDAEDHDHRFVVEVPAEMAAVLDAANKLADQARQAVFEHVGYISDEGRFERPCEAWVGDESPPSQPFWHVMYRRSESPDEWPAGQYDAHIASAPTAEEAWEIISVLPDRFAIHHHGTKLQLLHRDRVYVDGPHSFGGYKSNCFRCGNDEGDHGATAE